MSCLFCKIISQEIPAKIIYEDADIVAFDDISPRAPIHKLIIPKKHIETINHLETADAEVVGKLFLAAKTLAQQLGVAESGYRVVLNCNQDAGQTVFHIHAHLLAGRVMQWPPG